MLLKSTSVLEILELNLRFLLKLSYVSLHILVINVLVSWIGFYQQFSINIIVSKLKDQALKYEICFKTNFIFWQHCF